MKHRAKRRLLTKLANAEVYEPGVEADAYYQTQQTKMTFPNKITPGLQATKYTSIYQYNKISIAERITQLWLIAKRVTVEIHVSAVEFTRYLL